MSAFMVSDRTISICVAEIEERVHGLNHIHSKREIPHLFGLAINGTSKELGEALVDLNAEAVTQRYSADTVGEMRPEAYKHSPETPTPKEAHKALACLLYQCSEGNVPDTVMFKELEGIKHDIGRGILAQDEEYEALPWDFS